VNHLTQDPPPLRPTQGLTATINAEGNYGDRTRDFNQLYAGLIGWHGDSWGLLAAGSFSTATLANISYSAGNSWRASYRDGTPHSPATGGSYYYQPDVVTLSNESIERKRYGANISGQVKFGDAFTLTGDLAYNRLENTDRYVGMQFNSNYRSLALLPGSQVGSNGVVQVASLDEPRWRTHSFSRPSTSQAYNSNIELKYDPKGRFKATLRWVHGHATNDSTRSEADSLPTNAGIVATGGAVTCGSTPSTSAAGTCGYINPNGLSSIQGAIDYRGQYPTVSFGSNVSNPAYYSLTSTWADGIAERSQLDAFRTDMTFDTDGLPPLLTSIDFGGRYGNRNVSHREFRYLAPGAAGLTAPSDLYYYKDRGILHQGPTISGYSILPYYAFSSISQYVRNFSDFGPLGGVPAGGIPAIDPRAMDNALAFQNALYPGNTPYDDPTRTFRVGEKTYTGYAQANFASEKGILGLPFAGNAGVRVVHTNRTIHSFLTDPSNFIGTNGNWNGVMLVKAELNTTKTYTDVLPTANISFDLARNQKLRLAYAKVVGALNLIDLAAGAQYYYQVNGNPPRIPGCPISPRCSPPAIRAIPIWSPIARPITMPPRMVFRPWRLAQPWRFPLRREILPADRHHGRTHSRSGRRGASGRPGDHRGQWWRRHDQGIELGYQQQFDFLPGLLSGLGINANYTFSASQSSNTDLFGRRTPVPDNSKHQFNLIGLYQKGPVQARIAYNWRSDRFVGFQTIQNSNQGNLAIWAMPQGYLDASISYDITPRITVYAQGTNLTNEFEHQYLQFKNQFYSENLYQRRFFFGVRIRN
jgi:hypothetical protein